MNCSNRVTLGVLLLSVLALYGCEDLVIRDTSSLLVPRFQRSEILGLVAGFGTTFASMPDLIAMPRRRSNALRLNNCFATGDPLDTIAVLVNSLSVGAYLYFVRKEPSA